MQHTLHRMKLLIRWSLWGRRSKTISPTAKQLYSPMKTLSSNPWVKGKPLLPSCSDCAKLTPVKTPAIEVHWRGTSHGTGTLSNPHPIASEQLPTTNRDLTRPRHPFATGTDTCTTHVWFFRIQTYRFHPALLRSRWSGFLKHFLICIPVGIVWGGLLPLI